MKRLSTVFPFAFVLLIAAVSPGIGGEVLQGRWVQHLRQTPQDDITGLFPGSDYTFWASTEGSLHAYDGTFWKKITYEDQSLNDHTPFYRDENGSFYFEDGGDIVKLENGKLTRYDDVKIWYPIMAARGGDGVLYMGSYDIPTGGLYALDGQEVRKIRDGRVRSVTVDDTGAVWATILDPESGSMQLISGTGDTWTDRSGEAASVLTASSGNMTTVRNAPDGSLWLNNRGTYGVYNGADWTVVQGGSGPVFLDFDASGRVWGYGNSDLYVLGEDGKWTLSLSIADGIPNRQYFMVVGSDGVLRTFDGHHIFKYENDEWVEESSNFDLGSDIVTTVLFTDEGELWCGHAKKNQDLEERENLGLSVWNGTYWYNFRETEGAVLKNVFLLKNSPDYEVYAYTDAGIKIYNGSYWSSIDTLEAYRVSDFTWDSQNVLYVGSYSGLIEYRDPEYEFIEPPTDFNPWLVCHNLNFDDEGVLYMQTNFGTILSYDFDEEWLSWGMDTHNSMDIALEEDGTLWCARQHTLSWYDRLNGWQNVVEYSGGRFVDVDSDGRVWGSGMGTTGYYEDGVWRSLPEFSETASDAFAYDGEGRFALNAFIADIDTAERLKFSGVWEFIPGVAAVEPEEGPEPFLTAGNFPNPFNPSTTIHFTITEAGRVTVSVFNVNGQLVKTLASDTFPAGRSAVTWDATSENGGVSASGIYLYRVETGGAVRTGKMLLLR